MEIDGFANKELLFLLLLIPALTAWYWFRHSRRHASIQMPLGDLQRFGTQGVSAKFRHVLFVFRMLAMALLIVALARPQSSLSRQDISIEGIDIVLAFDVSTSMLARDFSPNRIEAAKKVAKSFVEGRPNDRVGLVVFSGETFTQCPLTTDHTVLNNLFGDIKAGMIEDGTAIGDGLATAVDRIKDSKAVSKVIILITDGVNNRGRVDPLSAAEMAELFGIRIYTIGVGTKGEAQVPVGIRPNGSYVYDYQKVEIDEDVLKEIASQTEGKYYRAVNINKLKEIYTEIDQMEKTKIDVSEFEKKSEEFYWFALAGILLLMIEAIARYAFLRILI